LWFFFHLGLVYVIATTCVPWLGEWARGEVLPFFHHKSASGSFEFLFSHLLLLSVIVGFVTSLLNTAFRHKAAQYVWIVPTVLLAYELVTFSPMRSVLQNESSALHQYFGSDFHVAEFQSWNDFWAKASANYDMKRGLAQLRFTCPFYVAWAYSLGAWLSRKISCFLRESGKAHFAIGKSGG